MALCLFLNVVGWQDVYFTGKGWYVPVLHKGFT